MPMLQPTIAEEFARLGIPWIGGGDGEGDGGGGEGEGSGDDGKGGDGSGGETPKGDDKPGDKGFKPIQSQEEFDRATAGRIKRAEAKAKADAKAEWEAEQQAKKDQEDGNWKKLYEDEKAKREEKERELTNRDLVEKKRSIAAKHHVPADLADLLQGATDEELEAAAKKVAASLKKNGIDIDAGKGNGSGGGKKTPTVTHKFGSSPVTPWPGSPAKEKEG